jgi:prolyl oligopeptidase
MRTTLWSALISLLVSAACSGPSTGPDVNKPTGPAEAGPPATEVRPATDSYHGTDVVDPYRWLEDWDAAEVKQWSAAQNAYARANLDALPHVDALRTRLTEILTAPVTRHGALAAAGDVLFAMRNQPPAEHSFLVVMDSAEAPESARTLVDPGALDSTGATSIDWFVPSPDGKLVAVSMSKGGSERGDVTVFDVATSKAVHEVIPHVNGGTAGGDLAWASDSAGFFYTRYPRGNERPAEDHDFYQQLYYHQLGTAHADDRYELGTDLPKIAEIQLQMHHRSRRLLVTVQDGDGGTFSHYVRSADGAYTQLSQFGDKVLQMNWSPQGDLFILSRQHAPRGKIMRLARTELDVRNAVVVVPESGDTLVEDFWGPPTIRATENLLYAMYQLGGPSEIRVFDHVGTALESPVQLPVSSVSAVVPIGGDDVLFNNGSFVAPSAWFRFTAATGETARTKLVTESPVDLSEAEVVREMAVSKDGTEIPLNIIIPKGAKRDGTAPCLVTGYGGYGVNITPRFRGHYAALMERGMIYVVVNLRGGGEYGERWHKEGNLTNKQNVFDDFAAALTHLVGNKYTSRDRLGIIGGSNGGLLMGATMVQHPEMVRAVVSFVGVYDMLRVENTPNGQFNITEYGTVKDAEHFDAMYAYSPYHNVPASTAFPATLMLTGENDPRVDPWHSRKMVARLQAATSSDQPILLRTSATTGHGGSTSLSETIEEYVDVFAFLVNHLGVTYE